MKMMKFNIKIKAFNKARGRNTVTRPAKVPFKPRNPQKDVPTSLHPFTPVKPVYNGLHQSAS